MRLISFGIKNRQPPKADRVYDCRSIPNPHNVLHLRDLDGRDDKVKGYVMTSTAYLKLIAKVMSDGINPDDTIAFYCYGGRHRSVAVVEVIAQVAQGMNIPVEVEHMELK